MRAPWRRPSATRSGTSATAGHPRALRSLMQLQFVDEIDTFYISKPERVLGGVRTNEYDNAIRVDNVQHSLMGLQKLLDDMTAGNPL